MPCRRHIWAKSSSPSDSAPSVMSRSTRRTNGRRPQLRTTVRADSNRAPVVRRCCTTRHSRSAACRSVLAQAAARSADLGTGRPVPAASPTRRVTRWDADTVDLGALRSAGHGHVDDVVGVPGEADRVQRVTPCTRATSSATSQTARQRRAAAPPRRCAAPRCASEPSTGRCPLTADRRAVVPEPSRRPWVSTPSTSAARSTAARRRSRRDGAGGGIPRGSREATERHPGHPQAREREGRTSPSRRTSPTFARAGRVQRAVVSQSTA